MGQGHGRSPASPLGAGLEWLLASQGTSALTSSERLGEVQEPQRCQTRCLEALQRTAKATSQQAWEQGSFSPMQQLGKQAGHRLSENPLVWCPQNTYALPGEGNLPSSQGIGLAAISILPGSHVLLCFGTERQEEKK